MMLRFLQDSRPTHVVAPSVLVMADVGSSSGS